MPVAKRRSPPGEHHRFRQPELVTAAQSALQRRPLLTSVAYTVVGVLPLYLTAAQSVRLQQELGFNRTQLGLIVGAFYLMSSIASKRVGPILDRRGPNLGFRLSGLVTMVAAVAAAAAPAGWVGLAVAMGLAGLGNAFGQIASNLVIALVVAGHRRGVVFAIKQSAVPVGAMIAGLAVPWIGLSMSWRVPYFVPAVLGLVMTVVAPRFETVATFDGKAARRTTPALAAFMVAAGIGGGIGNSLASFITDASVTRGFSEAGGARMLTVGSIVAIVARLVVGMVADRRRRSGLAELVFLLGVAVIGLTLLGSSWGSDGLFVVAGLLAFAGSWGWQGVMFYTVINIIRMPAATATGAVAAAAYLGTVIVPPLIGGAVDRWSYETVFQIAAVAMVVGIGALMVSRRLALRETVETEASG